MKHVIEIFLASILIILFACLIAGTVCSKNDCGNAKVVRGIDYIYVNQDSITEAYYHAKADSVMAIAKAKIRRTQDEEN